MLHFLVRANVNVRQLGMRSLHTTERDAFKLGVQPTWDSRRRYGWWHLKALVTCSSVSR